MNQPTEKESVVAIMPSARGTPEDAEQTRSRSISAYELHAESILIASDADYNKAAIFGRELKRAAAEVKAFFEPMKQAANRAHKEVCDREKIMLNPLLRAEALLKRIMGEYALFKEQQRKAAEAEARRLAHEEADRRLAEAAAAEKIGDATAAASALLDAQLADSVSRNLTVALETPKADGISTSKDWEIVSIDDAQVPIAIAGMTIRPVDDKAVIRLIRASKGSVAIPGVTYKEVVKTSIRK
jgi:hypothetical protein